MRGCVGVTDGDWYRFLADRPQDLREINFWRPGGGRAFQGHDDYDKLDVEPAYLAQGAAVLRLGAIYGARDPQRREEFILRRVGAGRKRIPVGAGTWLWTRGYVADLAVTRSVAQDFLCDSGKLARTLGWRPAELELSVGRSVRWHLAHRPESADADFTPDDRALAGR